MHASPTAKEASGQYPGVVKNQEFVSSEHLGQIHKKTVLPQASCSIHKQEAGGVPQSQWLLSYEVVRQIVAELVHMHVGAQL